MTNKNQSFDFDVQEEKLDDLGFHEEGEALEEETDEAVADLLSAASAGDSEDEDLEEENEELEEDEELFSEEGDEEEMEDTEEEEGDGGEEEMESSADEEDEAGEDGVLVSKTKIALAKQLLENIRENSEKLTVLFGALLSEEDEERISIGQLSEGFPRLAEEDASVIEGVFDGQNMIGPDGKEYSVPANYASKSKLVEGDLLKLTITDRGTFVYKQTKPVERRRLLGNLEKDEEGNFYVNCEKKKWRVLTASITYFKGVPGDKVVLLAPKASDSAWGAVENVIKAK